MYNFFSSHYGRFMFNFKAKVDLFDKSISLNLIYIDIYYIFFPSQNNLTKTIS